MTTSNTMSSSAELDIGPAVSPKPAMARPPTTNIHYKLSYWPKSNPINVITHDELIRNEIELNKLTPNTDYILQIVAFGTTTPQGPMTSEIALKHFKTLIADIKVPANLQVRNIIIYKIYFFFLHYKTIEH